MTFQGYLRNIEAKTGMKPADFALALGHGHAMAIYALLKGAKAEEA